MSNMQSRKRKRPITSCSECYRRKQKCDRELPCAICTIRGIPEKCFFDAQFDLDKSISKPSPKRSATSPTYKIYADVNTTEGIAPPDLGEQTGYSLANNSNFSILQKSLGDGEGNEGIAKNVTTHSLPNFVLYQISDIEKQLPSHELQSKLLDLFFDQCWWWFTSLEPISFRQRFDSWHTIKFGSKDQKSEHNLRDHLYFSALLFQTLAVALQYVHTGAVEVWEGFQLRDIRSADLLSIKFSKAGVQIVDLLGRHNSTVTAIQHDMLKGIWLKNFSRGTESWYSLGNAIRQAQELGLQNTRETPSSIQGEDLNAWLWQDLLNQRVWACLFSWDAHVSFTLGRPRIINAKDCTRMNLIACDIAQDTTSHPPPSVSDVSKPCLITPIIFHYSMAYMIHEMLDIGAGRPGLTDYGAIKTLHSKMDALLSSMFPYYKTLNPDTSWDKIYPAIPAMRFHLYTIAQTYLVALHRAHVLRRTESCDAAITSATNALDSQEKLFQITSRHKWRIYTFSFYTIDAAVFLAALLLEQPQTLNHDRVAKILEALLRALERLESMQESSPMAKTGAQIIRRCHDRIRKQRTITATPTTNGSLEVERPDDGVGFAASPSFRSWIEQMDQVMLPILEANPNSLFDDAMWEVLLEA